MMMLIKAVTPAQQQAVSQYQKLPICHPELVSGSNVHNELATQEIPK